MKRMQKENATFWNKERLRLAEAAGLTPNEVVTLASIVDEETANNAEKAYGGRHVHQPSAYRYASASRPDGEVRPARFLPGEFTTII